MQEQQGGPPCCTSAGKPEAMLSVTAAELIVPAKFALAVEAAMQTRAGADTGCRLPYSMHAG